MQHICVFSGSSRGRGEQYLLLARFAEYQPPQYVWQENPADAP